MTEKDECREVLRRTYLFLDGELLSETERVEIEGHLEECRPCLERYGLEQQICGMIARLRGTDHCPEDVKFRVTAFLQRS